MLFLSHTPKIKEMDVDRRTNWEKVPYSALDRDRVSTMPVKKTAA